ncbi:MAG: hypothetical protein ACI4EA_04850 [Candidatus Ornithomonoglobus sp.]
MYEYYQCCGNQQIPLTDDIRKELEFNGNKYAEYTEITDKNGTEGAYHDYGIKDAESKAVAVEVTPKLIRRYRPQSTRFPSARTKRP